MSKRAHLSFRRVVPVVALALFAIGGCGDDDSPKDGGTSGSGDEAGKGGTSSSGKGGSSATAGASGASGRGGAGGATGSGTVIEGDQCMTTAECTTGLTCLTAAVGQTAVRICARPCTVATEAADCGSESCESPYTGRAVDAHCINYEAAPFAICGVGETSACGGDRACLYFADSTIGVCVNPCATDPTQDSGIEDLPTSCPNSLTCVGGIADNDAVGVCGTSVNRDEVCGLETGKFCSSDADICVPDDLTKPDSVEHCRQDCTTSGMCSSGGTCTAVRTLFSYCKK